MMVATKVDAKLIEWTDNIFTNWTLQITVGGFDGKLIPIHLRI
jgi:hypothetical protein